MKKFLLILIIGLFLGDNVVAQFNTKTNLSSLTVTGNTREKPQSKVWIYDNKHWCLLSNSSGAHVWRLDGTSWTRILTVTSTSNLRADCKVEGNLVHIILFRGNTTELASIEYVPSNSTYKRWTARTSNVKLSTDSNAETATIDIDSKGRMWMVYDTDSNIMVKWSDSPYSSWSSPISVASKINADDIGAVIAIPAFNKIGVLWSNQYTERWGFKLHTDGDDPAAWSSDENPAAQYALNQGAGFSDDHMNIKTGSDGTLYCAVKTSYDTPGYTKITLLIRRPNGTWDPPYKVSESGTRGIVIVNEAAQKIRVIYTETETDGDIYYKESALSPISFGQQFTLISGNYNNPTSIKSNYTSQVVILASTSTTAVGVLVSDVTSPPPLPGVPTLASPANNATGIPINPALTWNSASNASTYQVQVSTSNTFSTTVADNSGITGLSSNISGLNYSTQYFWRVRATNVAGNSNWSDTRSFTTINQSTTVYSLTVTTNGSGSVSKTPDQASYQSGTSVQLNAIPAAGFQFSGWSGDASGSTNPLTVVMNGNKSITATFTSIPTVGVTGFNLINSNADNVIRPLVSGDIINLAALPTRKLNIQALTNPGIVGSVAFNLSGQQTKVRSDESGPTYSLFGDSDGNYSSWTPAVGSYTLSARTFTGPNGSGTPSAPNTITFTVIDQANTAARLANKANNTGYKELIELEVTAYPDPFHDKLMLKMNGSVAMENAFITLTTIGGKTVYQKAIKVDAKQEIIELDGLSMLPKGMYLLQLQTNQKLVVLKVLKH